MAAKTFVAKANTVLPVTQISVGDSMALGKLQVLSMEVAQQQIDPAGLFASKLAPTESALCLSLEPDVNLVGASLLAKTAAHSQQMP
ncbi:putative uncharacterized protein [Pseudomonas sp. StFLB209]|nr:putative uncharacterized protein [Pseudomonas sp. StFLB209]